MTKNIAQSAALSALIVVLGWAGAFPAFGGAVPITFQTLAVMLAGLILSPLWAGASVITVLVLAAIGLPVLSGGTGGLGVFAGPTVGYLIGFVFGAVSISLIARNTQERFNHARSWIAVIVGGIFVIYLFGIPLQAFITQLSIGETILSSLIFLPGDLIKAVLAVLGARGLWRAYNRAFPPATKATQTYQTPDSADSNQATQSTQGPGAH